MVYVWKLWALLAVCVASAMSQDAEVADKVTSEAEELNPDAEGVADGGDTEARFLFKLNRRRYNRRQPGYNGYSGYNGNGYNNGNGGSYYYQCQRCGTGAAVDYTTARRCCSYGYNRCCYDSGDNEVKPGTCPYDPYSTFSSSSYCRSECTRDSDCYSTQKCCQRGCSRSCQYPDQGGRYPDQGGYDKPGTCPYSGGSRGRGYPSYPYYSGSSGSTIGGSYCRRDCYSDQECPGSQKCCEVDCSSTCITPQRYY